MAASFLRMASAVSALVVAQAAFMPFDSFIELHGRSYQQGSAEFETRKALYEQRVIDSEEHNSDANRLWTAGVNKLWDWTEAELQTLRGWDGSATAEGGSRTVRKHATFLQQTSDLPKEKIWDNLAMSKDIRNQGDCGSCWAIAAATTLEALVEVKRGERRSFSTQQLISCVANPQECGGKGGCGGATVELAFDWIMHNGCKTDDEVPYQAFETTCTANNNEVALHSASSFGMYDWETLPQNKYQPLLQALMDGPVAVSVSANGWVNYGTGIFDGCRNEAVIDHAVVSHGYGEENGKKFWHISNSWGMWWGEGGRMRLLRTDADDSKCGWNTKPEMGTGCTGGPERVWVCGECGVLYDSVVAHIN